MNRNSITHTSDMYKGIFLVAAIVALVALCFVIRDIFATVTIAVVLFYILDPVANLCTGRKIGKRCGGIFNSCLRVLAVEFLSEIAVSCH